MDKNFQTEFRIEKNKEHLRRAYGLFCEYSFNVRDYNEILETAKKLTEEVEGKEKEVKAIRDADDHHTVENRSKVKALDAEIKSMKDKLGAYRQILVNIDTKIQEQREEGDRELRLAEYVLEFEMKEPAKK